jgi:hypothetical protein
MLQLAKNEYRHLQIYKGKCFNKQYIKKYIKAIVFDLDETLGSFADLYILWCGLNKIRAIPLDNDNIETQQKEFNLLLDLYPEFLRFGIINILEYLYLKKRKGFCDNLYIYTNNNCNPPWVSLISNYFNYKLNIKDTLFDKIISAFKINNKIIEMSRTTRNKTYNDFINCTLLPTTTEICFLDNTYYSDMVNDKVYYIKPRAYYHNVSTKHIIERFMNSNISTQFENTFGNKEQLCDYLYEWFELHGNVNYIDTHKNIEINVFVAQKMMYHIKEFFYLTQRTNKTRKRHIRMGRITRKYSSP